jgi:ribonuclease G
MNKQIIVNNVPGEKRIAVIEDRKLVEFQIMREDTGHCLGNIYSGVVKRVLPGMQSAFVEYGGARTGFIHVKDVKQDITYEEYQKDIDNQDEKGDDAKTPKYGNISEHIKDGQKILVQVIKEPIGQKGARLTTHISIPGRFAVLMPTISHIGISRKINDRKRRAELRELGLKVQKKGYGIIMRTLSEHGDIKAIEKDIVNLINLWKDIESKYKKGKNPSNLYQAASPFIEIIRNSNIADIKEIVLDNNDDYRLALDFISDFADNAEDIVKFYELPYPIFDYYGIEPELEKVLKKKIWLPSGGFLVIEQTEALTVIDVNTGKYTGKGNLENTVLKTNLEAVKEVTYHLRLRNIGGIVIVDFIDMAYNVNKKAVIDELEKGLEKDPAKCSVFYFTRLGLIQITRKRTSESNISSMTESCPYCNGNGLIKSRTTIAFQIFREIQKHVKLYSSTVVYITVHPDTAFILEHKLSVELDELIKKLKITVKISTDNSFHREHYIISDTGL